MTRHYLTQAINESVCLRGSIHPHRESGFNYFSYTQNGSSRKPKPSIEKCIPAHFDGYIVEEGSIYDAIKLTKAYRDGQHWAVNLAVDGKIRLVRNGKVGG